MEDAHAKKVEEVLTYFQVDPERGLSPDQVKRYQEKYGPNGESQCTLFQDLYPTLFVTYSVSLTSFIISFRNSKYVDKVVCVFITKSPGLRNYM